MELGQEDPLRGRLLMDKCSNVWVWLAHGCGWNLGWMVRVMVGEDVVRIRGYLSSSFYATRATTDQTRCFRKIAVPC